MEWNGGDGEVAWKKRNGGLVARWSGGGGAGEDAVSVVEGSAVEGDRGGEVGKGG